MRVLPDTRGIPPAEDAADSGMITSPEPGGAGAPAGYDTSAVPPDAPERDTSRRATRDDTARAFRPGRTPAGVVVAVAVAAVAWITVLEVLGCLTGLPVRPSELWTPLDRLLWMPLGDPAVPWVAGGMLLTGAALVALAVTPGRPRLVPLDGDDPLLALGLTPVGLRRTLTAAACAVPGVREARVRIFRRQIEITVVVDTEHAGELLGAIGVAVGDRLTGLRVHWHREVVVRLRGGRT